MAAWYPAMLVGWSLTQFAWQGALVLAAFLVVRRSLAGARAHARYRVALASLATLGALPLVTLVAADRALWSGPPAPDVAPAAPLYDAPAALVDRRITSASGSPRQSIFDITMSWSKTGPFTEP